MPEDVDLVLAYIAWEKTLCSCGHPVSDTYGKANTFRWGTEIRYCHACKARETEQNRIARDFKHGAPGAKVLTIDLGPAAVIDSP